MTEHAATIRWIRTSAGVDDYSRNHTWSNDSGALVEASASPLIVPPPLSGKGRFDPEQGFVASIAACHMLWFLSVAEQRGYQIRSYLDRAVGLLAKGSNGRLAVAEIRLSPVVGFKGSVPDEKSHFRLHAAAHERCFLAGSVHSSITLSPTIEE